MIIGDRVGIFSLDSNAPRATPLCVSGFLAGPLEADGRTQARVDGCLQSVSLKLALIEAPDWRGRPE